jgi:hypothetical protein
VSLWLKLRHKWRDKLRLKLTDPLPDTRRHKYLMPQRLKLRVNYPDPLRMKSRHK